MQGGILTIYDKEEAYVEALSDYLNKNMELGLVTVAFSDADKFVKHIESAEPGFVVVCEGFDIHRIEGRVVKDRIISLVTTREDDKNGPWIFKYQSAKAIVNELSSIIMSEDEALLDDNNIRIVFSTKSSIERGEYVNLLLNDLKNKGSVLYIDMEPFNGSNAGRMGTGRGLSELIYFLKQGGDKLKWKFKSLVEREDISGRILPVSSPFDLAELTREDAKELLNLLNKLSEYDFILINLGIISLASFELMKASSLVEIVVTTKGGDRESAENFISKLKLMGMKDVERRVEIVEFGTDTWI